MAKKKAGGPSKSDTGGEAKGPKAATHVNVRHILCEKHSKARLFATLALNSLFTIEVALPSFKGPALQITEALARIQAGEQFSQASGPLPLLPAACPAIVAATLAHGLRSSCTRC